VSCRPDALEDDGRAGQVAPRPKLV